jgi:hypothetical protein
MLIFSCPKIAVRWFSCHGAEVGFCVDTEELTLATSFERESKKRQEHRGQCDQYRDPWKNELPQAAAVVDGIISPRIRGRSKNNPQTIRMVIKHHDVLDGLDRAVVCRQQSSLLHDEDPPVEGRRLGDEERRLKTSTFVMFPGVLGRRRGWSLRKIPSFHDSHRTTGSARSATTRASDLCVTLKESARLLLSVDGQMRSAQELRVNTFLSAPNIDKDADDQDC